MYRSNANTGRIRSFLLSPGTVAEGHGASSEVFPTIQNSGVPVAPSYAVSGGGTMRTFFMTLLLVSLTLRVLAAAPASGTLTAPANGQTSSVNWSGGPYTAVTPDSSLCTVATCDMYTLQ